MNWDTIYKICLTHLLTLGFLLAFDPIVEYQKIGIKELEKRFDATLESFEYWDLFLGDKNVSMGYYTNHNTILYCNKQDARLRSFSIDAAHQLHNGDESPAFLGQKPGDKQTEGDLRTPVGVYKLTKKLSYVDPFYGPLALVTNYPNYYDRARGKDGSGIWIHGLPLQGNRDTYTKGCLAIDNEGLIALERAIDHQKTALLISPDILEETHKYEIAVVLSQLYAWRNAWKYNHIEAYLAFYAPEFKRYDGVGFKEFASFKRLVFANITDKDIDFDYINVIPYPNAENKKLFYITFIENYKASNTQFHGQKELYVEYKNDKISIVTEK